MIIFLGIFCIIIALIFKFYPPKINPVFGYKSKLANKNEDTWREALKYSSNASIILGVILIPLQFLLSELNVSYRGETIVLVICFSVMITATELYLRKTFDNTGIRKLK